MVDRAQRERGAPAPEQRLDLLRHVLGSHRADVIGLHASTPTASSIENATSAAAVRLSAPTSSGPDMLSKAVLTGTASRGAASSVTRMVGLAACANTAITGITNVATAIASKR